MTIARTDPHSNKSKKLPDQAAREVLDFVGYIRGGKTSASRRDPDRARSRRAPLAPVWDNSEDQVCRISCLSSGDLLLRACLPFTVLVGGDSGGQSWRYRH